MPRRCSFDVRLDRDGLVVASFDDAAGQLRSIRRDPDSVEVINELSERLRHLVVMRSFAEESDRLVIRQAQELGREIYMLFFSGFEDLLEGCTTIVCTQESYLLPLELAFDGAQFMGLKYSVGNWSRSLGRFQEWHHGAARRRGIRLLFLGTEDQRVWHSLRAPTREWECDSFRGTTADELLGHLRNRHYDILHFAGHGKFDEANPDESFFVLDAPGRDSKDSGLLRCRQLRPTTLRRPLVFLNTCQSGIVSRNYRGFVGFADAFLRAGAASCVATMWSITDQGAMNFAREFYRALLAGQACGEALRDARLRCWEDGHGSLTSLSYILFVDPDAAVGMPDIEKSDDESDLPSSEH